VVLAYLREQAEVIRPFGLLHERESAGMRLVRSEVETAFRKLRRSVDTITG